MAINALNVNESINKLPTQPPLVMSADGGDPNILVQPVPTDEARWLKRTLALRSRLIDGYVSLSFANFCKTGLKTGWSPSRRV